MSAEHEYKAVPLDSPAGVNHLLNTTTERQLMAAFIFACCLLSQKEGDDLDQLDRRPTEAEDKALRQWMAKLLYSVQTSDTKETVQ